MKRSIFMYALILAAATFLLDWMEYRFVVRAVSMEFFVALIAIGFAGLGIWVGLRLAPKTTTENFHLNETVIETIGLSQRECDVLQLLAEGQSNKEIARSLNISPNTVKSHLANLYAKLDVQRRTQAIQKARTLSLIP